MIVALCSGQSVVEVAASGRRCSQQRGVVGSCSKQFAVDVVVEVALGSRNAQSVVEGAVKQRGVVGSCSKQFAVDVVVEVVLCSPQ